MKTVVSLSFRPDLDDGLRQRLVARAGRLLPRESEDGTDACRVFEDERQSDRRFVAVSDWTQADFAASCNEFAISLSLEPYLALGPRVEGGSLLALLRNRSHEVFTEFSAPFGFCFSSLGSGSIDWVTDIVGLTHMYYLVGDGWVAASTSSRLLAQLGGCSPDSAAICAFGLTGNYVADRTPWTGVRKVMDGSVLSLVDGAVKVSRYADEVLDWRPDATAGDLVAEGASLMTELVENACRTHDRPPTLELSGGIDSRCLLAALSPQRRAQTTMLTLGTPGSPDWDIAARIAGDLGLHHQQVDLAGLRGMEPEQAWELAWRSALRYDVSGNVVANAVLMWVEHQVGQGPRFNGINGEYARGRFYSGQRNASKTDARVRRLAEWRIFANEAVSPAVIVPEVLAESRRDTITALQDEFRRYPQNWLQATDDHFVFGRMQRWAGIEFSASGQDRPLLAPFFTTPFMEWARRIPLEEKRASKLFSAVVEQLDQRAATYPLAIGVTPRQLARGGPATKMRLGARFLQSGSRKARQRFLPGTENPAVGSPVLAAHVASFWRTSPELLAPLERFPFLDGSGVASILDGTLTPSVVTVGFLTNLLAMIALDDDTTEARSLT